MSTMQVVRLPNGSTVEQVPEPGHGQVLLRIRASAIFGSDIRAIYRENLDAGAVARDAAVADTGAPDKVVITFEEEAA